MDKLTAIFDGLDLSKLVPQLEGLLNTIQLLASIAILIGPVVMVVMGVRYLFLPPKEANHRAGFRTYFGMGSVEAWLLTQKIAGISIGAAGLALGIVMLIICKGYGSKDIMEVVLSAIECLLWEAGVALAVYFGISITAAILFDAKGERRRKK